MCISLRCVVDGRAIALKDGWGCEISELQDENTRQFRKAMNTDVQYNYVHEFSTNFNRSPSGKTDVQILTI